MSPVTHSQQIICKSHFGFEGSQTLTGEEFRLRVKRFEETYDYIYIFMARKMFGLPYLTNLFFLSHSHLKLIRLQEYQVLCENSVAQSWMPDALNY